MNTRSERLPVEQRPIIEIIEVGESFHKTHPYALVNRSTAQVERRFSTLAAAADSLFYKPARVSESGEQAPGARFYDVVLDGVAIEMKELLEAQGRARERNRAMFFVGGL